MAAAMLARMVPNRVVAISLLLFLLAFSQPAIATTLFKRREATPQLPEDDHRLRRDGKAGAHTPEQVK